MKKILCLTDFSENAENGVLYANELAKRFSSTLVFMHTYKLGLSSEEETFTHPALVYYTDTESREKLYDICMRFEKENKYTNVNYEYIVKEGDVTQNLNEIIGEHCIDGVVLSAEGELRPNDAYYGSIVSEIVKKSKCPVVVVPVTYKIK